MSICFECSRAIRQTANENTSTMITASTPAKNKKQRYEASNLYYSAKSDT